jgi:hypothetical protein
VSWAYNRLPINWYWRTFMKDLRETPLYLRVAGPKDWPVKIDSTVIVNDLRYGGNDHDGWFTVGEVLIDGKAMDLPARQAQPGWKKVEGGADQPATAPESTPEDKEEPKPESEGRPQ